MRFEAHYIVAIEQPVQLLPAQGNDTSLGFAGPFETGFLQALLPQTKTTSLPVQNLHLVAPAVTEHKQMLGERIVFQCLFNQNRQTIDALAKVDDVPA